MFDNKSLTQIFDSKSSLYLNYKIKIYILNKYINLKLKNYSKLKCLKDKLRKP